MRLFVTVGTQFPFDRLVRTVDEWVGNSRGGVAAFAQVGPSIFTPRHMPFASFVSAGDCRREVQAATAVIAHAGMGSIITALEFGKPVIVMPRRADRGEHRNDHQLATARSLLAQGKVMVAMDEAHLREKLDQLEQVSVHRRISTHASPRLLDALRQFIRAGEYAGGGGGGGATQAAVAVEMAWSNDFMPAGAGPMARQQEKSGVLLNG
jgi:UDP-N-acetylglucosamine transferase subunit ALG13